jgi:hypothetical protein
LVKLPRPLPTSRFPTRPLRLLKTVEPRDRLLFAEIYRALLPPPKQKGCWLTLLCRLTPSRFPMLPKPPHRTAKNRGALRAAGKG